MTTQPARHSGPSSDGQSTARAALRHLRQADARLGRLIEHIGPYRPVICRDPFVALISSVIQQQVSMPAAATIEKRVRALCPRGRFTSAALLALSEAELRGAGLSRQKAAYVRNVADAFASRMLTPAKLRRMSDDEVVETTTQLKGIGRWTAEMLLIFCLERADVWPVDDLGLRKAVQNFLGLGEMPRPKAILDVADGWRPYRSYATWYLWRSLEGPLMPGVAL